MARNLGNVYGVEGEFYVKGDGFHGQDHDLNIIDYNRPPKTQPGLWCQWTPNHEGTALIWDGGEKFYDYIPWIKYLINSILAPKGYVVNGEVSWVGEDNSDRGIIRVKHNKVFSANGYIEYGRETEA